MEFWERMAPRERRLISLFGVVALVCVFAVIGIQIKRGLAELDDENSVTRQALDLLAERAAKQGMVKSPEELAAEAIGEHAPPLATYLDQIAKSVDSSMTIPTSVDRPDVSKGQFTEKSVDIELRGVTLDQLDRFLKQAETGAPGVVTQRIRIAPYTGQRDKLDVQLTISAFERNKKPVPAVGDETPAGDDDTNKEGT
jgi:hypothetical protein